jgi:hypothetical protein
MMTPSFPWALEIYSRRKKKVQENPVSSASLKFPIVFELSGYKQEQTDNRIGHFFCTFHMGILFEFCPILRPIKPLASEHTQ